MFAKVRAHRLFSGGPACPTAITLTHQRIYILPNRRGVGFGLLIILLLTIAFVYGNNLVYLLAFLLTGVFMATLLHTFKALAGLVLQPGHSKPVFAGDAAQLNLHISNPSAHPRPSIAVRLEQTVTVTLHPHGKTCVPLQVGTRRRGWCQIGKIVVSSDYPLGLFQAWSPLRFDCKVLVYPRPASQGLPFPDSAASGNGQSGPQKGNDDFYGVKEYRAGDAIKHIHWKALAKRQGLYSKQYSGESGDELWLDYHHAPGYDTEERLSQLCRWVVDAEQGGLRYGLRLPGQALAPGNGPAHQLSCLEALALFNQG